VAFVTLNLEIMTKNEVIENAYGKYWDSVKDSVDEDGWVYTKEVSNMLDAYFENNTSQEIEFQKSFGRSGDNPNWTTRAIRS